MKSRRGMGEILVLRRFFRVRVMVYFVFGKSVRNGCAASAEGTVL